MPGSTEMHFLGFCNVLAFLFSGLTSQPPRHINLTLPDSGETCKMVPKEKPIIVATAFNAPGHTAGLLSISEHLIKQGFTVYFIAGPDFKASIEKIGAEFVENPWVWAHLIGKATPGDKLWNLKHIFADSIPVAHRVLKETLERIRREKPHREVLILHESFSNGLAPFVYGAPLPEGYSSLPKVINFHTSIYAIKHDSIPPFGPGLRYDHTPENLALWRSISDAMEPAVASVVQHLNDHLKALGATRPATGSFFDVLLDLGDVTVLATSPSLEYPLPEPKPKLRFIGGLPLKPLSPTFEFPSWWPTITNNTALPADSPDKKKLVFVTQGTAHRNYIDLIIPTINALANRADLLVVATLGARGAELPSSVTIPANTIVVDYFPYDAVLPHADVFVSNAGYGGFMQGVMNGVPMVLAGTLADKAEVCARAEYAGVAVNLRAQNPGEDAIRAGVENVLGQRRFKERAVELKEENEKLDSLKTLERIIDELVGGQ
ncbi:glycosyltransferase family 1 protein [Parathielavia appendiculata]|uniref:Glycosyltransferase family 1 protein n=1 Tax=Parathielavia appendiculata TaxID=2587402 RepID=A0AAN6YYC1_9PEZI|nr:glycosyltransferase family 1 protein [Parathielavia appendiculata]